VIGPGATAPAVPQPLERVGREQRVAAAEASGQLRLHRVIGDITEGGGSKEKWFNTTPIGSSGSAFARPAQGTFGDMERGSLTGPGFWNVDASLFKRFRFTDRTNLELRLEVTNVFNHVALGNPDTEVGVPGNDNPNAGRINGTAANWLARNLQFAVRFQF
jgi:hypothetical protein